MTWKELKKQIECLTEEQLNTDVTVYYAEEMEFYTAIEQMKISKDSAEIDEGQPFITVW